MGEVTGSWGNNTFDTVQEVGHAQPCCEAIIDIIPLVYVSTGSGESLTIVLGVIIIRYFVNKTTISTKENCLLANSSVYSHYFL